MGATLEIPIDPGEEKLLAEQRQLADEERARRACADLEAARQRKIEQSRRAAGVCTQCGGALGPLDGFLRREHHRGCRQFV